MLILRMLYLCIGFHFLCTLSACPKDPKQISADSLSVYAFLHDAILKGLQKDRAPKEVISSLSKSSIFVPKCRLCDASSAAFNDYLKAPRQADGTFPFQVTTTTTRKEKMFILSQMVYRYTEQHFVTLNLNKNDEAQLRKELEGARKQSISLMSENFGSFCPSCDGACAKPQFSETVY